MLHRLCYELICSFEQHTDNNMKWWDNVNVAFQTENVANRMRRVVSRILQSLGESQLRKYVIYPVTGRGSSSIELFI